MPKLLEVKARPDYRLWLRYDDGAQGEVDLSDLVGRGVFALWNEPAAFEGVHIGPGGGIAWTPEVELCPDATYLRLTGKPVEELLDLATTEPAGA